MAMYEDDKAIIKVFSAGRDGARAVARMAGRIRGVDSFGMIEELAGRSGRMVVGCDVPAAHGGSELEGDVLRLAMGNSHLVFVVSSFEDELTVAVARSAAEAAGQAGAFTLGISAAEAAPVLRAGSFNSLLHITPDCIVPRNYAIPLAFDRESLLHYLMRQAVHQITTLITEQSIICVDFADVKAVFAGGGDGYMGIGVAGGPGRGTAAAVNALEGLARQEIDVTGAAGVLACITGSTNMTMEDFDAVSRIIHETVPEEANLICGLLVDDALGDNMKVTLFANFNCFGLE